MLALVHRLVAGKQALVGSKMVLVADILELVFCIQVLVHILVQALACTILYLPL